MDAYQTIIDELRFLRGQLAAEQRDLVAINTQYEKLCRDFDNQDAVLEAATLPMQREVVRARIRGIEIRIGEVETIKTELEKPMLAAAERQRQEAEKVKWEGIRTQYLKARDEFDELKAKLELTTATAEAAQKAFEVAQEELAQFRDTPCNPLDLSPADLTRARRRDAKLEQAARDALAERDMALIRQGGIRRELLDVGTELARLAWTERNYRPEGIREAATAATLGEAMARQ